MSGGGGLGNYGGYAGSYAQEEDFDDYDADFDSSRSASLSDVTSAIAGGDSLYTISGDNATYVSNPSSLSTSQLADAASLSSISADDLEKTAVSGAVCVGGAVALVGTDGAYALVGGGVATGAACFDFGYNLGQILKK